MDMDSTYKDSSNNYYQIVAFGDTGKGDRILFMKKLTGLNAGEPITMKESQLKHDLEWGFFKQVESYEATKTDFSASSKKSAGSKSKKTSSSNSGTLQLGL